MLVGVINIDYINNIKHFVKCIQLVHFMESGAIMVQIWGKQKPTANKKKPPPSSTKIAAAQRPAASLAKAAATKVNG